MTLRTAYLDVMQTDLTRELHTAVHGRCTVLVYGPTTRTARLAAAVLTVETRLKRPLRITRQHDRWTIDR